MGLTISDIAWNPCKFQSEGNLAATERLPPSHLAQLLRDSIIMASKAIMFHSILMNESTSFDAGCRATLPRLVDLALIVVSLGGEEEQDVCLRFLQIAFPLVDRDIANHICTTLYCFFNEIASPNVDISGCISQFSEDDIQSVWRLRIACQRSCVGR